MTTTICRFCHSSNTKLTSSLNDTVIKDFLSLVPEIKISISKNPKENLVCQLCYSKSKISYDFIMKVHKTMQNEDEINVSEEEIIEKKGSNVKLIKNRGEEEEEEEESEQFTLKEYSFAEINDDGNENDYENEAIEVIYSSDQELDQEQEEEEEFNKSSSQKPEGLVDSATLQCLKCNKKYSNYNAVLKHMQSRQCHPPDKIFQCRDCDKEFCTKSSYSQHRLTHKKDEEEDEGYEITFNTPINYTCSQCRKKYSDLDSLTEHMKSRECLTGPTFTCEDCGKIFTKKHNMKEHQRSMHRVKEKIPCEYAGCEKSFFRDYDLETHMEVVHKKVISRNYIFKCTHCNETFSSHLELADHVKEHQKEIRETPRLCEVCAKVCANLKAYLSHMTIHKEKKPHNCTECGKGFNKAFLLVQHMHVHTGIKSFVCGTCNKSYAKRDSLRVHRKKEHPEEIS